MQNQAASKKAEYQRKHRTSNPERYRQYYAKYRANNRVKRSQSQKAYLLKSKYGITLEERDDLLAKQGGVCAVCSSPNSSSKNDWHVDHCHGTGKIRGILCHPCNTALGLIKDNTYILRKLAEYIENQRNETPQCHQ